MASLKVLRPPVCSDSASDVPRSQWPELLDERINFCKKVLPSDCRLLLFFVEDALKANWMGFADRESYLRNGLHLDPKMVELALRGLKLSDPDKPLGFDPAIVLGEYGINQHTRGGSVTTSSIGRGRFYILARLDRDGYAKLAAKVRADELSANAAAIEAGFRKQSTPLDRIQKLWLKLDAADRRRHLEWTLQHCATCGREGMWEGGEADGMWCDNCCVAPQ